MKYQSDLTETQEDNLDMTRFAALYDKKQKNMINQLLEDSETEEPATKKLKPNEFVDPERVISDSESEIDERKNNKFKSTEIFDPTIPKLRTFNFKHNISQIRSKPPTQMFSTNESITNSFAHLKN